MITLVNAFTSATSTSKFTFRFTILDGGDSGKPFRT